MRDDVPPKGDNLPGEAASDRQPPSGTSRDPVRRGAAHFRSFVEPALGGRNTLPNIKDIFLPVVFIELGDFPDYLEPHSTCYLV